MFKKYTLSAAALAFLTFSQASASAPFDPQEVAASRAVLAANYTDPRTPLPGDLREIFDTNNPEKKTNNTGAGMITAYVDPLTNEQYVVYGLRCIDHGKFLSAQAKDPTAKEEDYLKPKLTTGGKVEETDESAMATITRENAEEHFNMLPIPDSIIILPGKGLAGGFVKSSDNTLYVSKGWGPYHTFFAIDRTKNLADLEKAVEVMNDNANRHVPVADFFHSFEKMTKEDKQQKAAALLQNFENVPATIVPLTQPTQVKLSELASDGDTPLGYKTGFDFAREHVHDYTEYFTFGIMNLKEIAPAAMFEGENIVSKFIEAVGEHQVLL